MSKLVFSSLAWNEYLYWQMQDRKTLRRINQLLQDIQRSPFSGIGKPEPLKQREGCWSRRIDDKNRLVYRVIADRDIEIISCSGHYDY